MKRAEQKPLKSISATRPSGGKLDELLNSLKTGAYRSDENQNTSSLTASSKEVKKTLILSAARPAPASKNLDFLDSFSFNTSFETSLMKELASFSD